MSAIRLPSTLMDDVIIHEQKWDLVVFFKFNCEVDIWMSGVEILQKPTSVKRNDDYMIGRLNILRLSHKVVTLPLWLTM